MRHLKFRIVSNDERVRPKREKRAEECEKATDDDEAVACDGDTVLVLNNNSSRDCFDFLLLLRERRSELS